MVLVDSGTTHHAIHALGVGLCEAVVASTSKGCLLMHSIGSKHRKGGSSLQLFAVIGHALGLRDDPNHLAAVERRVLDLSLEWESSDLR